jgi:hypothetical protein
MGDSAHSPRSAGFEWNAGGWFGAQLGSTAWLFIGGFVLLRGHPASGLALLGCGLAANLLGSLLWMQRRRLSPYRGIQVLVAICCAAGLLAVRWLDLRGELGLLDPRVGPRSMYVLLLGLLLGLLGLFASLERGARRAGG